MADEERWEVVITVPPVVEDIVVLAVRCGHSVVDVRQDGQGWAGIQSGYKVVGPRPDYEATVAETRRWVEAQERRRLLTNGAQYALRAESTRDGESDG